LQIVAHNIENKGLEVFFLHPPIYFFE